MKICVAMSGGVDSSTTAYLLKEEGHDVFGLFVVNWEEKDHQGQCLAQSDYEDMIRVCHVLDIPYYRINFAADYSKRVFSQFLSEIKQGYTPNPDILCNREIKFDLLFKYALALGADALATGHYCQVQGGKLLKGKDPNKDQSYFLYTIKQEVLKRVLFPIGHLCKSKVRAIARQANLPVAEKKDSTGICFIGKRDFKRFLINYIPTQEGVFKTLDGQVVGTHQGAVFYTIGQRKGLGIGGEGGPWFVVDKDINENSVTVAQGTNHPALFHSYLTATDLSWIASCPPHIPCTLQSKIRYRQQETPCTIESIDQNRIHVAFKIPQRAITPRQSIVFYDQEVCLGGGMIESRKR